MTLEAAVRDYLDRRAGTLREIAAELDVSRREVELAVQALRLSGHPIVSDSDGLRLSHDPDEVQQCAERLLSRLAHQAQTARALEATAKRMRGVVQERLWAA